MIDITDKTHQPSIPEIEEFIKNPLFSALCAHLITVCGAKTDVVYSGESALLGWNVRFYRAGRTLCRLYPKVGSFKALIVIGRREKDWVEALLPGMSDAMRALYLGTREAMGQRWLMPELCAPDALYADVLTLIGIRLDAGRSVQK